MGGERKSRQRARATGWERSRDRGEGGGRERGVGQEAKQTGMVCVCGGGGGFQSSGMTAAVRKDGTFPLFFCGSHGRCMTCFRDQLKAIGLC